VNRARPASDGLGIFTATSLPQLDLQAGSKVYPGAVSTYTIGEVAERSGFSASALRYYEDIGLVPPAGRSGAGYRMYDDLTLNRLAFVARAKQLGCTLEEIADLVEVADREPCAPVQRRFHALVTAKLTAAERQVAELTAFRSQLRAAAVALAGEPVDGPCDAGCACLAATPEPDIACTLTIGERPARRADWRAALAQVRSRTPLPGDGLRLEFDDGVPAEDLARLVAAEQGCCAFFSFSLTFDGRGLGLEVTASAGAERIMQAMFGARTD
jgi:MerR family transcriptional regulator, copper efflux regulator